MDTTDFTSETKAELNEIFRRFNENLKDFKDHVEIFDIHTLLDNDGLPVKIYLQFEPVVTINSIINGEYLFVIRIINVRDVEEGSRRPVGLFAKLLREVGNWGYYNINIRDGDVQPQYTVYDFGDPIIIKRFMEQTINFYDLLNEWFSCYVYDGATVHENSYLATKLYNEYKETL